MASSKDLFLKKIAAFFDSCLDRQIGSPHNSLFKRVKFCLHGAFVKGVYYSVLLQC